MKHGILMGAAVVLSLLGTPAMAQSLGNGDLKKMHDTYDANQARFMRDYVGKQFSATMPLHGVRENPFIRGRFAISFGSGRFSSDVDCNTSDKSIIDRVVDMNKGDQITVSGTIKDHVMGSVILEDCEVRYHSCQKTLKGGNIAALSYCNTIGSLHALTWNSVSPPSSDTKKNCFP
jgi:hypothetical protein